MNKHTDIDNTSFSVNIVKAGIKIINKYSQYPNSPGTKIIPIKIK